MSGDSPPEDSRTGAASDTVLAAGAFRLGAVSPTELNRQLTTACVGSSEDSCMLAVIGADGPTAPPTAVVVDAEGVVPGSKLMALYAARRSADEPESGARRADSRWVGDRPSPACDLAGEAGRRWVVTGCCLRWLIGARLRPGFLA